MGDNEEYTLTNREQLIAQLKKEREDSYDYLEVMKDKYARDLLKNGITYEQPVIPKPTPKTKIKRFFKKLSETLW